MTNGIGAANDPVNLSDPSGHCNGSLVSDTCDGDESQSMPSFGAVTLPNGRKVDPWFLESTGQTAVSYAAALNLKAYEAENGITRGITASQLNASLSSTALTPIKANYLHAMLASGTLSSAQASEVWSVLHPLPRSRVESRVVRAISRPHLALSPPTPLTRPLFPVTVAAADIWINTGGGWGGQ